MTDTVPERVARAFSEHEAFEDGERSEERRGELDEFLVRTTDFDATVRIEDGEGGHDTERGEGSDDAALRYCVLCRVPTLSAAVEGPVAEVVEEGWFDTFSLRLEDAAMAVPGTTEIAGPEASVEGETILVEADFEAESADRATDIAKALVDYVEGTYVEGVIPGYEYRPPVSGLLANARQGGGDTGGDDSGTNAGGPMPM
ncbi:hypothetical protein BRC86_07190 [Halobacteriales archaeon QS_3_64_16]|nr:MAG: hypothetical protein BRC86_07190 [Halobacteriales archaeon QS_3_64_16]